MAELKPMTIDEHIKHHLDLEKMWENGAKRAKDDGLIYAFEMHTMIATDHRHLAEWLTELKKAKSMILDYSYTVEVMCNRIKNTMGCENCTYCNADTHDCEVRAYISKTRAFVKGDEAQ